jgi:hypothetical protein
MMLGVAYVALDVIAVIATLVAFSCLIYLAVITYRERAAAVSRPLRASAVGGRRLIRPSSTADACVVASKGVLHHERSSHGTPSLQ